MGKASVGKMDGIAVGLGQADLRRVEGEEKAGEVVDFRLLGEEHAEQAKEVLRLHFEESMDVIEPAIDNAGQLHPATDSNDYLVMGLLDDAGVVQAVAVCLVKQLPRYGLKVLEIVWFGALAKGQGWGGRLFDSLVTFAKKQVCVDAILSTSTNTAVPFWLSRKNVRIADTVLRFENRGPLNTILPGFKCSPAPTNSVMARLYSENVLRNRKGKIVGAFQGKPYHYSVEVSNHVWFLLNPKLSMKSVLIKR